MEPLLVEVWSDVVCPWCYIGKRRLEAAVASLDGAADVEVVWRSFQLDPSAPTHEQLQATGRPPEGHAEHLARKYGGGVASAQRMIDRMTQVAAAEGLDFHLERSHPASTLDAHRLLHEARRHGTALEGALEERLLQAYFVESEAVEDPAVLERHAVAAGVPAQDVARVLASDEHADAVAREQAEAVALGASGVPFAVVDRRYGVAGAQPAEVFAQALRRALADRSPVQLLAPAGAAAGETCGPEGCAS